jgi:hypothetical protein
MHNSAPATEDNDSFGALALRMPKTGCKPMCGAVNTDPCCRPLEERQGVKIDIYTTGWKTYQYGDIPSTDKKNLDRFSGYWDGLSWDCSPTMWHAAFIPFIA